MGMSTPLNVLPKRQQSPKRIFACIFLHSLVDSLSRLPLFFRLQTQTSVFLDERVELDNASNSPLKFFDLWESLEMNGHTHHFYGRMQMKRCAVCFLCRFRYFYCRLSMFVSVEHFMHFRLDHHACGTFSSTSTTTHRCGWLTQKMILQYFRRITPVNSAHITHTHTICYLLLLLLLHFLWNVYYFALSLLVFIVDSSTESYIYALLLLLAYGRLMMWDLLMLNFKSTCN